jgi:hypothetical protein
MRKKWLTRPEIVIPSLLAVWLAAAAAYALVLAY